MPVTRRSPRRPPVPWRRPLPGHCPWCSGPRLPGPVQHRGRGLLRQPLWRRPSDDATGGDFRLIRPPRRPGAGRVGCRPGRADRPGRPRPQNRSRPRGSWWWSAPAGFSIPCLNVTTGRSSASSSRLLPPNHRPVFVPGEDPLDLSVQVPGRGRTAPAHRPPHRRRRVRPPGPRLVGRLRRGRQPGAAGASIRRSSKSIWRTRWRRMRWPARDVPASARSTCCPAKSAC